MPTIRYGTSGKEHEFEEGDEVNLLRVSIRYDCGVPYKCASGNCGTDKVYVEDGHENLSRIRPKERERLGDLVEEGFRLACQTYASGDVTLSWDKPDQAGAMPERKAEKLREYWLSKDDTE